MDDAWDPDALPRVLTRADALRRGLSRRAIEHRVATGRWRRVLPGTYLTADSMSELDSHRAALAFAGPAALLSGAAGLRVCGLARIPRPQRLLVLVPPAVRLDSAGFVQIRRTFRPVCASIEPGPRHAEVARAAADYVLTLRRLDDVRALVATVIQDGRCTLDELGSELAAGPRNGSRHLRQALEEVGQGAASAPEAQAARILRHAPDVPSFEQNARIDLPGGRWYVADFLWRELRAVLEIDSVEYHLGPREWRATMDRHLELASLGFSVVHRPPSVVRNRAGFATDIARWLAARAAELR